MHTNSRIRVSVILGAFAITIGALLAINLEFGSSITTDEISGDVTKMPLQNENTAMVSPYAGQESRNIKSLSQSDLLSLQDGSGEAFGGLAKAAELNGYPGPRHVLDMASELELTSGQRMELEKIFQNMSSKAKTTGREIIAIEREMDIAFANHTITPEALKLLTSKSAELHGQLRFVHLSAHLDTMQILTAAQVQKYIEMRGYDGPAGHGRNGEHDGNQMHNETS